MNEVLFFFPIIGYFKIFGKMVDFLWSSQQKVKRKGLVKMLSLRNLSKAVKMGGSEDGRENINFICGVIYCGGNLALGFCEFEFHCVPPICDDTFVAELGRG